MDISESEEDTKKMVPPGLIYLADNITLKQNVLGAPKASKSKWAKDLHFSKETGTIFFAGCGYQYDRELESLMALLRRIDQSPLGADAAMNLANMQKKIGID